MRVLLCLAALFPLVSIAQDADGARHPTPARLRSTTWSLPRPIDGAIPFRNGLRGGAAGVQLVRWIEPRYGDGEASPGGQERLSARAISQVVCREEAAVPNPLNASSFFWQWGQFLDHDLDMTSSANELYPIRVPVSDEFFDPEATASAAIEFFRSAYDQDTGRQAGIPRQQMNFVTAYIDASNVYGSDLERATALMSLDGTGGMLTSPGDLLPFNVEGLPNSGGASPELFLAGDVRANEQIGLTAMHVLFVREHNRWAEILKSANPGWTGGRIYQFARMLVGAEIQAITYREFLPLLLGANALPPYTGYREHIDPSIANVFATVAFRVGHSMLNSRLLRLNQFGKPIEAGPLDLSQAFFRPSLLEEPGMLESLLRGLAGQRARAVDPFVTDAVRNFLFGQPGEGGFDLAALNIQRGRDHGIPDYNTCRTALGLAPKTSFASISSNPEVQSRLQAAYGSVDAIDPWIGGIAEDRLAGALVGEFFFTVLRRQFENLRDGDPYWYEWILDPPTRDLVEHMTLGQIIRLNTAIRDELSDDVFRAPGAAPY